MSDQFPEDVRRFITDRIDSVEQLEILLLLREGPEREWTAEAVGQAIYTSPLSAHLRLTGLQTCSLVSCQGNPSVYRYQRGTPETEAIIDRLRELYRERRVSVIGAIYSRSRGPAQAFADAFKFRKGG